MPETLTLPAVAAQDGVDREASQDPSVHRVLVVVDPPMQGRDVANLQRAIRARLKARGRSMFPSPPTASSPKPPRWPRSRPSTSSACARTPTCARTRKGHRILTEGAQRDHPRARHAHAGPAAAREGSPRPARARPALLRGAREVLRPRRRRQGRARVRGRAGRHQGAPGGLELRPEDRRLDPRGRLQRPGAVVRLLRERLHHGRAACPPARAGSATRPTSSRARRRAPTAGRGTRSASPATWRCSTRPAAPRRSTSRSSASASRTPATRPTAATRAPATAARATAAWSRAATTARRPGPSRSSASRARRTSSSRDPGAAVGCARVF